MPYNSPQHHRKHLEKPPFIAYVFQNFAAIFHHIFPLCDTCDSKKTTSLLEGARVHAYEKKKIDIALICYLHYAKQRWRKISCHFFLDFSLFEDFSTPICIGTHSRCAFPISNSTFTATAKPIYFILYVPYKFLHRLCIHNRRATNAAFEGWGRNYRLQLIELQSVIWCQ